MGLKTNLQRLKKEGDMQKHHVALNKNKLEQFDPGFSNWHEELCLILSALDDLPLECDGISCSISLILTKAGIKHRCVVGYVSDLTSGNCVTPHVWIELIDGWIIDYRLRMWFGDEDEIPHGIFHPSSEPTLFYKSTSNDLGELKSDDFLDLATVEKLSHVKVSSDFVLENPNVTHNK
ncbi:hypothetical protein [Vibrio casei]|uniref:hypothetical protein n=2 Tax=Gammaproteobacteria TaxID=1236 RepID=UPI001FD2C16A|nr:hypothetical protein [Vibrio casei]